MLASYATQLGSLIQRLEEWLLALSILTIASLTILNVGCRSLFGFSLSFAEEVAQFCIILVCFVGLSYAASKGRHIRMTAIYDALPVKWRKRCMLLITSSTAAIMFTLTWYAMQYVYAVYQLGGIYPALGVPYFAVYTVAPLGLGLAGIQYSLAAVKNLYSPEIYVSFNQIDDQQPAIGPEI